MQTSPSNSGTDNHVTVVAEDFNASFQSLPTKRDVVTQAPSSTAAGEQNAEDPLDYERLKKENVTSAQMKKEYPDGNKRKLKKYYTRQNELIDEFLGAGDEERLAVAEAVKMGPRIRFAVNASFAVNFCLFCIQLYAAVSTGSLSLFATAADAFVSRDYGLVHVQTDRQTSLLTGDFRWILSHPSSCLQPPAWPLVPVSTNTQL